jgi:hypothetical protein
MPNSHVPANGSQSPADEPGIPTPSITADIEVSNRDLMLALTGPGSTRIAALERHCGVSAGVRGDVIRLQGHPLAVQAAERVLAELMRTVGVTPPARGGVENIRAGPRSPRCDAVTGAAFDRDPGRGGAGRCAVLDTTSGHQTHDIVFGVGPAGTSRPGDGDGGRALASQRVSASFNWAAVEAGSCGFCRGTPPTGGSLPDRYDASICRPAVRRSARHESRRWRSRSRT